MDQATAAPAAPAVITTRGTVAERNTPAPIVGDSLKAKLLRLLARGVWPVLLPMKDGGWECNAVVEGIRPGTRHEGQHYIARGFDKLDPELAVDQCATALDHLQ